MHSVHDAATLIRQAPDTDKGLELRAALIAEDGPVFVTTEQHEAAQTLGCYIKKRAKRKSRKAFLLDYYRTHKAKSMEDNAAPPAQVEPQITADSGEDRCDNIKDSNTSRALSAEASSAGGTALFAAILAVARVNELMPHDEVNEISILLNGKLRITFSPHSPQ